MARYLGKACADRKQDIERWEVALVAAAASREMDLIGRLHRQIAEAKQVITDSGY
jgi:hypothetical protein